MGVEADPRVVAELHRRTEGWVAGLILAGRSGGRLGGLAPASSAHFEYLAEEVVSTLPETRQQFLIETSLLDRFSPHLAAAVTGSADAEGMARDLVADHLFTSRLDVEGEWYRYHQLLQAFLRRRSQQWEPERIADLHRRAASWWLAADEPAEAVPHLLAAGEARAAVEALEPVAENMACTPEAETLADWLDAIPPPLWEGRSSLVNAHASLLLTRAEHEASFAAFDAAIDALIAAGDQERAAAASVRLLQSMITAGTPPRRRIEAGRHHLDRLAPGARLMPAARILLATSYAYACRFDDAEGELAAALGSPAGVTPVVRAYAAMARAFYIEYPLGRGEDALAALDQAIVELERYRAEDELAFLPYARVYRGYLLNDLARPDEALSEAARTGEAFSHRGIARSVRRALDCIRLTALAALGRWDELEVGLAETAETFRPAESSSYGYRYRDPGARLAAHRGDSAAVQAHVAAARDEMRAFGIVFDNPMFLCNFARSAWEVGLVDLARELAGEASRIATAIGVPAGRARAALLGSLAHGPCGEGDQLLADALQLSEEWRLTDLWARRERAIAGGLLARAVLRALGPSGAAARLAVACGGEVLTDCTTRLAAAPPSARARLAEAMGAAEGADVGVVNQLLRDPHSAVRAAARRSRARLGGRTRLAVRISTLGGLSASRGGRALPDAAFGRKKARELLGVLVSASRPVHRDAVLEWLWPQLPPERGSAALRTTLHQLRRALEPELAQGDRSSLVVGDGETFRLALDEDDELDVTTFLGLARPATGPPATEIPRLEAAEVAYRGPFLPEWPYEEWAQTRRGDLEERYRDVLAQLGDALVKVGRVDAAIPRYRKLVVLEPEREGWHRALMEGYGRMGERALALRQYHACRGVLRRELGIEPAAETRALYGRILREDGPAPTLQVAR